MNAKLKYESKKPQRFNKHIRSTILQNMVFFEARMFLIGPNKEVLNMEPDSKLQTDFAL